LDPFNDLSGSGSLGVVLSDQCGVWIFNSEDDIQNAYDRGLFQNSQTWFGTDSQSGYGIMLMTDSKENQCAYDVMTAVNWDSLN
jgi:cation transport regulator ChaC